VNPCLTRRQWSANSCTAACTSSNCSNAATGLHYPPGPPGLLLADGIVPQLNNDHNAPDQWPGRPTDSLPGTGLENILHLQGPAHGSPILLNRTHNCEWHCEILSIGTKCDAGAACSTGHYPWTNMHKRPHLNQLPGAAPTVAVPHAMLVKPRQDTCCWQ
jgi:hypothetical protein